VIEVLVKMFLRHILVTNLETHLPFLQTGKISQKEHAIMTEISVYDYMLTLKLLTFVKAAHSLLSSFEHQKCMLLSTQCMFPDSCHQLLCASQSPMLTALSQTVMIP
jgi:hypothetical protein